MDKKTLLFLLAILVAPATFGAVTPQDDDTDELAPTRESSPIPAHTRLPPSGNAHYLELPIEKLYQILDDPKNRVSEAFKVDSDLKPLVGFWFKIYTKYSAYQALIYDRDNPEIVYEVIDSRDFFQRGLSPMLLEISVKNRVRRAISGYKIALQQLQKNPQKKFASGTPGATLLRLWGRKSTGQWRNIESAVRMQIGQRDRIMDGLANAERFIPAMEAIFKKFGIPHEITRLPLVESSFNLKAVSKADAVGVWQFLERSAQEYLVVDNYNKIDERLSPIKSTYAAAKMFKRNYHILHDWGLAIIAYNHGAKHLIPIAKRYRGDNIKKLLYKNHNSPLGYASRSYYAEFLAILYAERYRDELYNMATRHAPEAISIVRMKKPASIFEIAALYNISIHELRVYNPDIFDLKRKLPAGTRVVLPRRHGESLVAAPDVKRGIASDQVEFIEYVK